MERLRWGSHHAYKYLLLAIQPCIIPIAVCALSKKLKHETLSYWSLVGLNEIKAMAIASLVIKPMCDEK